MRLLKYCRRSAGLQKRAASQRSPTSKQSATKHTAAVVRSGSSVASRPVQTSPLLTSVIDSHSPSVRLGVYIALWFTTSVVFNIVNRGLLLHFPAPLLISTVQLFASSLFVVALWIMRIHPAPSSLPPGFISLLLPVAAFHSIGHVCACVAFTKMPVSFVHVVKATEPCFTVALSAPLMSNVSSHNSGVAYALLCIIAGCFIAAQQEYIFSLTGFAFAMASNLGMVLRGLYSSQCLQGFEGIDGTNLFGLISITSLIFCIPTALIFESHLWPEAAAAAVTSLGSATTLLQLLLAGGVFYQLYNQLSYMVLSQGMSPVMFSVGNTMKRVAIIVSSVAFFKNPVSPLSWLGSAAAVFGTYWYSVERAKQYEMMTGR